VRVGKRCLRHATKGLAGARCLAVLLVRGEIEGDEENEVGGERANTSKGGKLLASALSSAWHPWEVGRGEVSVRREVDEAYSSISIFSLFSWLSI
jgi:hypothetical protein